MLFNIVNSSEQCWQQNIVQYCFDQPGTSRSFFAGCTIKNIHYNAGQQLTSCANTRIFRPSLLTFFEADEAVQGPVVQSQVKANPG